MAHQSSFRAQQIAEEAEQFFAENAKVGAPAIFIPKSGGPVVRAANAITGVDISHLQFKYENEAEAFPAVDPGVEPLGSMVLVQIRVPLWESQGVHIDADSRKTELDNTQAAKVVAVGPLAFKNRDTFADWPEGAWCKPGDYLRIPKYQGDRWPVPYQRADGAGLDLVVFVMLKDLAIIGKYPTAEAAMAARAFL